MSLSLSKSHQLYDRACGFLPGGVNSPVRSFNSVGGKPFVADKADGAWIYDVDGNQYIDLVGSWGPMIHGHNHENIRSSIETTLKKGASFGISCEIEYELSEMIVDSVPSLEMIRLVSSGTEACMSAIRLARAYTGRDLIVKFEGHYHGHGDSFLVSAGSGLATLGISASEGVPEQSIQSTLVLPFNDEEALRKAFDQYSDRIAGVMLELVTGNMGVMVPTPSYIQCLQDHCKKSGALLIADEVMTGFRLSLGGAQEFLGVEPDISTFGKIIGGGLPVGAFGASRKIMSKVAPLGAMYQAGTLSGNPLGAAAGLASLRMIRENPKHFYQHLDSIGSEWASFLNAEIDLKKYPVSVVQCGSMLTIFFRRTAPRNFAEAKECDLEAFKRFFWALLEEGVYYPPSQFESSFLSSAHDPKVMETVAKASARALEKAFRG